MLTLDHSPVRSDPKVLGGTMVFRDTRVPAQTLFDYIDRGHSLEIFLDHFPTVQREDALELLHITREENHS